MLILEKGGGATYIVVTLTEKTTITSNPVYYLFVFTHIETKYVVKFILSSSNDISLFKYRYNKWIITPSVLFNNAPDGDYLYEARQQISPDDLNVTDAKEIVEVGKAIVVGASQFDYDKYNIETSYKSYNG